MATRNATALTDNELLHRYRPVLLGDSADRFNAEQVPVFAELREGFAFYWIGYSGDRDHAGTDWEMIALRLDSVGVPDVAVYAAHRGWHTRPWARVRKAGDHPIVFVSRDKHSSRFRPGWHRHGRHLERCNGKDRLDTSFTIGLPVALHDRRVHRDPVGWFANL